jgi:hypothetical protein
MRQELRRHIRLYWHWWLIVLLSIIYLVLQYNRFFNVLSFADTDDTLQYNLSKNLSEGKWLGPYTRLTLIKGVGFPAWTAFLHQTHTPLWLGNALLTIFACVAIVYALRRTSLSRWMLVTIYGVLLFNPMLVLRVYRDLITSSLALLVCSWAIGMFILLATYRQQNKPRILNADFFVFSCIGIVSLPMWYYVREDPLWIMLLVYLLLGVGVLAYLHNLNWQLRQNARIICMILVLLAAPIIAVNIVGAYIATQNQSHYGRYVINDYFSKDFENAYAALSRVQNTKPKLLTVPVSYEMREKIYKVSPAFSALKSCLDSAPGYCEGFEKDGPNSAAHDYEGGWFPFALRLAVEQAGYYTTPNDAKAYYLELTKEIDSACKVGTLQCDPVHTFDLMPLPSKPMLRPLLSNWLSSIWFISTLRHDGSGSFGGDFTPIGPTSADRDVIARYYSARYAVPDFGIIGKIRNGAQRFVYKFYATINLSVMCISLLALGFSTVVFIRKHAVDWKLLFIGWLLLATVLLRSIMLSYVQTVSFPTATNLYFASTYPFIFLFELISLALIVQYIQKQRLVEK